MAGLCLEIFQKKFSEKLAGLHINNSKTRGQCGQSDLTVTDWSVDRLVIRIVSLTDALLTPPWPRQKTRGLYPVYILNELELNEPVVGRSVKPCHGISGSVEQLDP